MGSFYSSVARSAAVCCQTRHTPAVARRFARREYFHVYGSVAANRTITAAMTDMLGWQTPSCIAINHLFNCRRQFGVGLGRYEEFAAAVLISGCNLEAA